MANLGFLLKQKGRGIFLRGAGAQIQRAKTKGRKCDVFLQTTLSRMDDKSRGSRDIRELSPSQNFRNENAPVPTVL